MPDQVGIDDLVLHWKRVRDGQTVATGGTAVRDDVVVTDVATAELRLVGQAPTAVVSRPELLFRALVEPGAKTLDGDLVIAVTPAFLRFVTELERDPEALHKLNPRQLEELVAGAYEEEGWEVILTPRARDRGRNVIATHSAFGTIRVIDQVKLYAPHRVVDADDVRALYGVLSADLGASKGIVTTSSAFAPGVYREFALQIPGRLTLRDGAALRKWLYGLRKPTC